MSAGVLVVVPTYDEAATIDELLRRVLVADERVDVLVVDDGSPDGTGDQVAAVAARDLRVHLLRRPGKGGLGEAYRAGFAWGLARGYEAFVEMDADLSHPPERLGALIDSLDRAEVVVGSRYVPGGRTVDWPRQRRWLSKGGNAYVRLVLGLGVRDATSGFRAYRRTVLEGLPVAALTTSGYGFQIEALHRARRRGFTIAEIPITFTERAQGVSKMHFGIVVEALARVTGWALRGRGPIDGPTPPRRDGVAPWALHARQRVA